MWQIAWMMGLLPNWFWTSVLILGILLVLISTILKAVPFVRAHALAIQVIGIVACLLGVYFQGVISNETKWQLKVKQLEEQIKIAENKSKEANYIVEEKIVYRDRIVRERGEKQIVYVDRIVKGDTELITKDMSEAEREQFRKKQEELEYALKNCPVPQIIIEEHNKAAVKEINRIIQDNKR
jgi:hypothetical protein